MMDIGKTLKEERERLGLTIDAVAEKTLVRQYYLSEIEEDYFPEYDGYTAAYIRKYAEFIGLETQPFLEAYKDLFKGKEVILKPYRKNHMLLYIAVVLILIFIVFLLFRFYSNKPNNSFSNPSQTTENPSTPVTPSQGTPTQPNQTQPVEEAGVHLILKGSGLCWLGVTNDGKYSQTYIHEGETLEFRGNNFITIRYGFAPYVSVIKNGKNLGVVNASKKVVEVTYKP
jgi:cytoskeletal protein RodZ